MRALGLLAAVAACHPAPAATPEAASAGAAASVAIDVEVSADLFDVPLILALRALPDGVRVGIVFFGEDR